MRYLLTHGTILTTGNVLAGTLSYIFIVLVARGLGPADFGSLGVLLTFLYISVSMIHGVQTLVAQNVVETVSDRPTPDVTGLVRSVAVTVGLYSAIAAVAYIALSPLINSVFEINSIAAVVIFAGIAVIRALGGIMVGALQGLQRFPAMAAVTLTEAALRLALGLLLVAAGLTLLRTISIYLITSLVLLIMPAFFVPVDWSRFFSRASERLRPRATSRAYFTGIAFCLLAALTQVDMLAAKLFLSADVAGFYAAATNLVKAPFLLVAGAFATVMFPSVVRLGPTGRGGLSLLAQTFGLVAAALGIIVGVFYATPGPIVSALLGAEFAPLARWFALFALGAIIPGLLYVVSRYCMVGQGAVLVAALTIGLLAEIAWLVFFHHCPEHLIGAMAIGSGLPLLVLTLNVAVRTFRRDGDQ